MTLPVTPEDAGTPDGSSTTLTLDASLPARPWSSSLCCTRATMGWQHRKKSTLTIEFDGRIKYGETVDQVHDSIEAEQRRQRDLERAGWKVIRVRWSDLTLINEVVAQVLVAIRAKVGR